MSKQKNWKKYLISAFVVVLVGIIALFVIWSEVFAAKLTTKEGEEMRVYVDKNQNLADFISNLEADSIICKPKTFIFACRALGLKPTTILPPGCYPVFPEMTHLQLIQRVQRGEQVPVKLTINYMRLPEQFASKVSHQLMLDSAEIMNYITDKERMAELGYAPEHLFALVIRNTYEVWWTVSVEKLMQRLKKENDAFWNANDRRAKAQKLGLTIPEVITLASIVEEETNHQPEKSRVAGLYLNRLRKGIRLQSDPTVKYALKDFKLNRILFEHLKVDDPYNTYVYAGLPPGPIRLPSIATIDAVLNAEKHNYIYMCAHPDFNGTHNFAVTLAEHNRNAAKYHVALRKWLKEKNKK
ncbi:MAG: endolytic transglycosylase MltG [Paludibacteraceae bacterium]|nr:endolytic transglycosylase MltG [Paludibacteraceae bacterium]